MPVNRSGGTKSLYYFYCPGNKLPGYSYLYLRSGAVIPLASVRYTHSFVNKEKILYFGLTIVPSWPGSILGLVC
jgi:hypothetical protein